MIAPNNRNILSLSSAIATFSFSMLVLLLTYFKHM
jgi:hypothetical protein